MGENQHTNDKRKCENEKTPELTSRTLHLPSMVMLLFMLGDKDFNPHIRNNRKLVAGLAVSGFLGKGRGASYSCLASYNVIFKTLDQLMGSLLAVIK